MTDEPLIVPPYGPSAVPDNDLDLLRRLVKQFAVQTVVEFGPGRSTYVFLNEGCRVWSYEYDPKYLAKITKALGTHERLTLQPFVNASQVTFEPPPGKVDLVFVDSPSQHHSPGMPKTCRLDVTLAATRLSDRILLHDAKRPGEKGTSAELVRRGWTSVFLKSQLGMFLFERRPCQSSG
jgi:hypothetical protein